MFPNANSAARRASGPSPPALPAPQNTPLSPSLTAASNGASYATAAHMTGYECVCSDSYLTTHGYPVCHNCDYPHDFMHSASCGVHNQLRSIIAPPPFIQRRNRMQARQAELDLDQANDRILGSHHYSGFPTFVPDNTPAATEASEAGSHFVVRNSNLGAINEAMENMNVNSPSPSSPSHGPSAGRLRPIHPGGSPTTPLAIDDTRTNLFMARAAHAQHPSAETIMDPHAYDEGVNEHTDWHDDILQDLDRVLARVENLAVDDAHRDPSMTVNEHFKSRMTTALAGRKALCKIEDFGLFWKDVEEVEKKATHPDETDTSGDDLDKADKFEMIEKEGEETKASEEE